MTKISLTPVIDVVFILLIFFMLATNFNQIGEINMGIILQKMLNYDTNERYTLKNIIRALSGLPAIDFEEVTFIDYDDEDEEAF